ncbi:hypothetical protein KO465_02790 [Candidatus Micrarchaeota archaeon]|nr:hypothetical protein [Candidatus Micrarchaeota archaeon]
MNYHKKPESLDLKPESACTTNPQNKKSRDVNAVNGGGPDSLEFFSSNNIVCGSIQSTPFLKTAFERFNNSSGTIFLIDKERDKLSLSAKIIDSVKESGKKVLILSTQDSKKQTLLEELKKILKLNINSFNDDMGQEEYSKIDVILMDVDTFISRQGKDFLDEVGCVIVDTPLSSQSDVSVFRNLKNILAPTNVNYMSVSLRDKSLDAATYILECSNLGSIFFQNSPFQVSSSNQFFNELRSINHPTEFNDLRDFIHWRMVDVLKELHKLNLISELQLSNGYVSLYDLKQIRFRIAGFPLKQYRRNVENLLKYYTTLNKILSSIDSFGKQKTSKELTYLIKRTLWRLYIRDYDNLREYGYFPNDKKPHLLNNEEIEILEGMCEKVSDSFIKPKIDRILKMNQILQSGNSVIDKIKKFNQEMPPFIFYSESPISVAESRWIFKPGFLDIFESFLNSETEHSKVNYLLSHLQKNAGKKSLIFVNSETQASKVQEILNQNGFDSTLISNVLGKDNINDISEKFTKKEMFLIIIGPNLESKLKIPNADVIYIYNPSKNFRAVREKFVKDGGLIIDLICLPVGDLSIDQRQMISHF